MRRKQFFGILGIILLLTLSNIITIILSYQRVRRDDIELEEAYSQMEVLSHQVEDLNKGYEELTKAHTKLKENKIVLEEKNKDLIHTYQTLIAQYNDIKKKNIEMKQQISSMDDLLKDYDHASQYDPVTFSEYQTYIKELEERILKSGGFDIYEKPKRWQDYDNITIWLEDGASRKWADQANSYLKMLPSKMLEKLKENGWMIIITPRDLERIYESNVPNTVGLTIYYRARIYLQNREFSIDYCTIHEVGHAMDFIHNFVSCDQEWKNIYTKEAKTSQLGEYFTESASEYFAESFQTYFLKPEELNKNAPETYQYMKEFVDQYQ